MAMASLRGYITIDTTRRHKIPTFSKYLRDEIKPNPGDENRPEVSRAQTQKQQSLCKGSLPLQRQDAFTIGLIESDISPTNSSRESFWLRDKTARARCCLW
jgi:hypothetical protein